MKKLASTWYNMAIVLTLIAVIAGASLAGVNELTKEPIAKIQEKSLSDGISAVLQTGQVNVQSVDSLENGTVVYKTDCGCAVQATDGNAFGGKLTVLVGFADDGVIRGYKILQTSETPGLGAKAETWFQEGQKGCIVGMNPSNSNMTVSKDGGDVDAITASTITSRAFLRCVNAAYAALGNQATTDAET
ncbi:MAG: FMN-binding protein, partial [Bacteroidaceae bacterium]|nr:FMN-binding protein [Bacteroidaceae bacterium]